MYRKLTRWSHRLGLSRRKLRGGHLHRRFGDRIFHSDLWKFTPKLVARAWLIAIFSAASPFLGLHMFMSIAGALIFRANLPISAALVWVNNPVTMLIYYPLAYWFGCKITHHDFSPHIDWHHALTHGWTTFQLLFVQIWKPLLVGCTIIGLIFGLFGYLLIILIGRITKKHQLTDSSSKRCE